MDEVTYEIAYLLRNVYLMVKYLLILHTFVDSEVSGVGTGNVMQV